LFVFEEPLEVVPPDVRYRRQCHPTALDRLAVGVEHHAGMIVIAAQLQQGKGTAVAMQEKRSGA